MDSIQWDSGVFQSELGFRGHGGDDVPPVPIHDLDHARRLIGQDPDNMWRLRALLASRGDMDVARLDDRTVTEQAALLLAARRLELRLRPRAKPGGTHANAAGAVQMPASASPPRSASTPSRMTPRAGHDEPSPVTAATVMEAPEFAPALHQRQAATLRRAAREGAPFCEVCEQAKALREAAAMSAGF